MARLFNCLSAGVFGGFSVHLFQFKWQFWVLTTLFFVFGISSRFDESSNVGAIGGKR